MNSCAVVERMEVTMSHTFVVGLFTIIGYISGEFTLGLISTAKYLVRFKLA